MGSFLLVSWAAAETVKEALVLVLRFSKDIFIGFGSEREKPRHPRLRHQVPRRSNPPSSTKRYLQVSASRRPDRRAAPPSRARCRCAGQSPASHTSSSRLGRSTCRNWIELTRELWPTLMDTETAKAKAKSW
nr:hypothetical protein CFP56_35583 [Quercus suber]